MVEDIPELMEYQDFAYAPNEWYKEQGIYVIDDNCHVNSINKDNYGYNKWLNSATIFNPPKLHHGVKEKIDFFMKKFKEVYGDNSITLDYGVITCLG
jgi:hypothetical protein